MSLYALSVIRTYNIVKILCFFVLCNKKILFVTVSQNLYYVMFLYSFASVLPLLVLKSACKKLAK